MTEPYPGHGYTTISTPRNGIGTAALVVAIVGLLLFWSCIGAIVLGIVAIALGIVGMSRAKSGEATNRPIAIAGVALGFLGVIVGVAMGVIIVVLLFTSGFDDYLNCVNAAGQDQDKVQQCIDDFTSSVESRYSSPEPR